MNIFLTDCEVFQHDWLVVAKEYSTKEYRIFHNDNYDMEKLFSNRDNVFVFFNGKNYDRFIIAAILNSGLPNVVKTVNDWIISGKIGWDFPDSDLIRSWFNVVDLMDDMQMGLSLKAIEGHLGMDIRESTVSFDLDRPLTEDELAETIYYCKHDVDATERLLEERKTYLNSKIQVGQLAGIDPKKALYMTNAKLTAAFLNATLTPRTDEREYQIPSNLDLRYVPQEAIQFYERVHDKSVSDKDLFGSKLNLALGKCEVIVSFGGIHGCIPNFMWEETS